MKKLLIILSTILIFACSPIAEETIIQEVQTEAQLKGPKPPKKTSIVITPTIENTNSVGRIMETPVDYNGTLPADDNGGLVDWDNDGDIDDLIVITREFNHTTVSVLLNGTEEIAINYSSSNATLLGFIDANNDGYMDVITEYGNPNCYDGTIGDLSDIERPANQYNVGLNVEGQYPLSRTEILSGPIDIFVPNGKVNNIKWDLSDYGFECYQFRLEVFGPDYPNDGNDYFGMWTGYGEWGYWTGNRLKKNKTYRIDFRDIDNGNAVTIEFEI
jgi:hypothetical protein